MPFIRGFLFVFGVFLVSFATFDTVRKKPRFIACSFFSFAYCLTGRNKLYLNY